MKTVADEEKALDRALVDQAKSGNQRAFATLVTKYQQRIFNFCYYQNLAGRDKAKEAVDEIFIRVSKGLKSFRGEASFKNWLYAIAKNVCKDQFKRLHREEVTKPFTDLDRVDDNGEIIPYAHTLESPEPSHEDRLADRQVIKRCLKKMNPLRRNLIVLIYFDGYSYEEVAAMLRLPVGTVRSYLNRAIKEDLKDCLKKMGLI